MDVEDDAMTLTLDPPPGSDSTFKRVTVSWVPRDPKNEFAVAEEIAWISFQLASIAKQVRLGPKE